MTSHYGAVNCTFGFNLPGLEHFPLTPNGRVAKFTNQSESIPSNSPKQ